MSNESGQREHKQTKEQPPKWGDPISLERQAKLQGYLDRWETETDHGKRKGPFDSGSIAESGIQLTGADISGWQSRRYLHLSVVSRTLQLIHCQTVLPIISSPPVKIPLQLCLPLQTDRITHFGGCSFVCLCSLCPDSLLIAEPVPISWRGERGRRYTPREQRGTGYGRERTGVPRTPFL